MKVARRHAGIYENPEEFANLLQFPPVLKTVTVDKTTSSAHKDQVWMETSKNPALERQPNF